MTDYREVLVLNLQKHFRENFYPHYCYAKLHYPIMTGAIFRYTTENTGTFTYKYSNLLLFCADITVRCGKLPDYIHNCILFGSFKAKR
jgi:hypothetical protein